MTTVAHTAPTGTFGRHYVFAFFDRTTISVRTRLDYAFSPSLTLEGCAEPLGDPVRLGDLRSTTRARGDNFLSVKVSYWLPVGGR